MDITEASELAMQLILSGLALAWAHPIAATAAICGLAGNALLAWRSGAAGRGFVLFLVSNIAWLTVSYREASWFFFAQQLGFTAFSLLGIWRWRASILSG